MTYDKNNDIENYSNIDSGYEDEYVQDNIYPHSLTRQDFINQGEIYIYYIYKPWNKLGVGYSFEEYTVISK